LLIDGNIDQRQYHGITHVLNEYETGQRVLDLIVIEELVKFLNDRELTIKEQIEKYE